MRLSDKYGANPHMTFCPRCGGDTNELVLTGSAAKYECKNCHGHVVGHRPETCPHCRIGRDFINQGEPSPWERMPSSDICDECKEDIRVLREEVEKGGVPFKCKDCKAEGVIRHDSEFAIEFRKEHPAGWIMFDRGNCPSCGRHDGQDNQDGDKEA